MHVELIITLTLIFRWRHSRYIESYYTNNYSNENIRDLIKSDDIHEIDVCQIDTTNITKLKISFDPWHSNRFHSEIKDFEWLHESIKEIKEMECINNGEMWSNKFDSCVYCD